MNRSTIVGLLSVCAFSGLAHGRLMTEPERSSCASSSHAAERDIVDTAVAAGNFNTLAAALRAAGLVDSLKGAGPFTVFAPTDEAFKKLPAGTLDSLLKPENKAKLVAILKYHVVVGNVMAADARKLSAAPTLNGQRVEIVEKGSALLIDGSMVTAADIKCSNGVIHVIDTVMLPSDKDIIETAVAVGKFNTLAAALKAAGLTEVLKGTGPFTVFAPTDEAFAKLPSGTVEALLKPENKGKLIDLLKYHVVEGRVFSGEATKLGSATTLQGGSVTITSKGSLMIDNAKVVSADVDATNGVIHVIDTVIMPH